MRKADKKLPTWKILGEILATVLLLYELLVDILVDLVLLLQMLPLVLHGNPTDDAVKQLKRGDFILLIFSVIYSTLLHLPPPRFHCVGGSNPGQLQLRHRPCQTL